ncbi:hypothetical protein, partial [Myroides injenensis]|uniref:hypothetical protein n=1 Tax=Myroides injenensis TaxID=1183151 RepID=UPI000288BC77
DISQNVINEITNNPKVVDKIKEITTVKVVKDTAAETGELIAGKKVFKLIKEAKVASPGTTSLPYNSELNVAFEPEDFARLLSVQILKKDGQLVMSTVTDVKFEGGKLTFKFGVGSMYSTLPIGDYDVIIEYVSTKEPTTNNTPAPGNGD